METKVCTKCGDELPANKIYFSADKSKKSDGLRSECKECAKKLRRIYIINNKERLSKKSKETYQKNKKYHHYYNKDYHKKHKEEILERKKEHYYSNIDSERERNVLWRNKNKKHLAKYSKERNLIVPTSFIVNSIHKKTGVPKELILNNPELIETKRLLTKIKRELWKK